MKAALKAVEDGQSVSGAARDYGIPDRVSGRVIHGIKPGPRLYLSPSEEGTLRHFLKHCAKLGYGKTRKDVLAIAESTAIDKGLLKSSRITEGWWRRFIAEAGGQYHSCPYGCGEQGNNGSIFFIAV